MNYFVIVPRIIFILGITNLISSILVYMSCRCLPMGRLGKQLMKYPWFQKFYKWHCTIWQVFLYSVAFHAVLALIFYGWPG